MALRRWRTVSGYGLVTEGVQTGDGRVIAADAITWAELPLPFAWLRDGDQHINLTEVGPQVGIIDAISRGADGQIEAEGAIDDENPDGAELIRRMEAGSASHGNQQLVSIDPDDWAVDILLMDSEDTPGAEVLLASRTGRGPIPLRNRIPAGVTAAAGDPDPGPDGGVLLFSDAADAVLERYTRMRIRGVTACAVSAFTSAMVELVPDAAPATEPAPAAPDATTDTAVVDATTAAASPGLAPSAGTSEQDQRPAPPRAAFTLPEPEPGAHDDGSVYGMPVQELLVEQPDGGLGVPWTIVERDGVLWGFGHAALWGTCHVGYTGDCVTAPDSPSSYAHFHHGAVLLDDGTSIATGPLTMGCDHAGADLFAPEARDWYANSGLAFADVRATDGALGVWVAGAIRPGLTAEQVHVARASSLSGDWRRIGVDLEFIGALAVNVPGFPIARELRAAAGLQALPMAALAASAHWDGGVQNSLVAAGIVQRCPECQKRAMAARGELDQARTSVPTGDMAEALGILRQLDYRTRPMIAGAAEHALAVIRRDVRSPGSLIVRPPLDRQ